jgi:hypothetical protein
MIEVGKKLFILNVKTNKITETYVKEIVNSDSDRDRFVGFHGTDMVVLHKYQNPLRLNSLKDHLKDKRRKNPEFIGQEIFCYSNLRVFVALTEKECKQHIVNNVIPYQLICKEQAAQEIITKYNNYMEEVGQLEKLAEKIKSEL